MKTRKPKIKYNVYTITIIGSIGTIRCPRTQAGYERAILYACSQRYYGWSDWAGHVKQELEALKNLDAEKGTRIPEKFWGTPETIEAQRLYEFLDLPGHE